jgi:hydroxypyruvate reductase
VIISDRLVGDVEAAAAEIIGAASKASNSPACLVFGGETTVTLRGTGNGGRNQELALRVAMAMPDLGRDWAFLSGGTDGRDGPTEAAGGLVDAGTVARIRQAGGDPAALLAQNDSNRALALADDLLVTGATGTNVADVQILMLGARA